MWKSRIGKLPPTQFFADLIQHLRNLYPGATIDDGLVRTMSEIWVAEWRAGQSAQDTAKATCSCDGKAIVPSAGAGRDLGKRLARPPKGAKRGDFIAPAELREVSPLAAARREAEKYSQAFDRVRAAAMTLLQAKGWTPSKGLKLQRLQRVLHDLKAKHDVAVKKYEEVRRSRKESQQPTLYEKPLGALGLSLRPDELPEPPPPKTKKAKKEKSAKQPKEPKEPKEPQGPRRPKPAAAKLDANAKQSADRKTTVSEDCNCKKGEPPTKDSAAATHTTAKAPKAEPVPQAATAPEKKAKPKRERKAKAEPAATPTAPAALSDAEAEELANLFATASAEDKKR